MYILLSLLLLVFLLVIIIIIRVVVVVVVVVVFILVTDNSHLSHPGKSVLFCFKAAQNVWNNHGPRF